ncbi:hypothetical protein AMTRI_Chr03g140820 [Amborella trichopoda]
MEHGNYEEAIQVVNHFLSSSSNPLLDLGIDLELAHASFSGLICLGDMHFALSHYDDAISCYTSALALQRQTLEDSDSRLEIVQGIERGNSLLGLRRQDEVAEIAKGVGFSLQIRSRFWPKWWAGKMIQSVKP